MADPIEPVLRLLPTHGTLEQARRFLKAHGAEYSASNWTAMIEERFRPAIRKGTVSTEKLLEFFRSCEEHGDQHVFLYQLAKDGSVKRLFDGRDLEKTVNKHPDKPEMGTPSFEEMPQTLRLIEVRREVSGGERRIVIKLAEKRFQRKNRLEQLHQDRFIITYELVPYRAVNVVRIREDGRVEVRIQSHKQIMGYSSEATAVWSKIGRIVSAELFRPISFAKLKERLWDSKGREKIAEAFSFKTSSFRNPLGTVLSGVIGPLDGDLLADPSAIDSLDTFSRAESGTFCESADVYMKEAASGGNLFRDVHLLFPRVGEEFILTEKLDRNEYEHVLGRIERLAR